MRLPYAPQTKGREREAGVVLRKCSSEQVVLPARRHLQIAQGTQSGPRRGRQARDTQGAPPGPPHLWDRGTPPGEVAAWGPAAGELSPCPDLSPRVRGPRCPEGKGLTLVTEMCPHRVLLYFCNDSGQAGGTCAISTLFQDEGGCAAGPPVPARQPHLGERGWVRRQPHPALPFGEIRRLESCPQHDTGVQASFCGSFKAELGPKPGCCL